MLKELQGLLGHLTFVCRVVVAGRAFCCMQTVYGNGWSKKISPLYLAVQGNKEDL